MQLLQNLYRDSAEKYGDLVAFQIKKSGVYVRWTFRQVAERVDALAAHLISLGVKKGDRVAILGENRPEWAMAYLSVVSLGAVAVPFDIMAKREDILPLLEHSEAGVIITSLRAREEKGEKLVPIEVKMEEIPDLKPAGSVNREKTEEDDLAAILYTSGTTGMSKGVMLTQKNIMIVVKTSDYLYKIGPGDMFLSVLPIHHSFEATCGFLTPFYLGAAITYAESLKSHNLLANMQETGTTIMLGVPMLFNLFYNGIMNEVESKGALVKTIFKTLMFIARLSPSDNFRRALFPMIHKKLGGRTRFWISGGAPIDPDVIRGFGIFGIKIMQGYGLTETAPSLAANTFYAYRVGSVGWPLREIEVKIAENGEIVVRGPNVMKGYYKRPDLTAEVLKDGWFHTGDLGRIDSDGFLFITGRIKDVIVTGSGMNVYPEEIEVQLARIKGVKENCVVGAKIKSGVRVGSEEVWAVVFPDYEYFEKQGITDRGKVEQLLKDAIFALSSEMVDYKRIANVVVKSTELPKTTKRTVKKFQVRKELGLV